MKIWVEKIMPNEWKPMSENAHKIAFKEYKRADLDRIDFALIVRNEAGLMGYLTCREHDSETLYWQFGGAFPGTKESSLTYQGYLAFVDYARARYKRVTTLIENSNLVMLKMAMKVGFRIVGVRSYKGILLEHVLEFENA